MKVISNYELVVNRSIENVNKEVLHLLKRFNKDSVFRIYLHCKSNKIDFVLIHD